MRILTLGLLVGSVSAQAQTVGFTGVFSPSAWTFTSGGSPASFQWNENGSLTLVGSDVIGNSIPGFSEEGFPSTTSHLVNLSDAHRVSFSWSYVTTDGTTYDPAGYTSGGTNTVLTGPNSTRVISGTASDVFFGAGQSGFFINSNDNRFGAPTFVISNFSFRLADAGDTGDPLPPTTNWVSTSAGNWATSANWSASLPSAGRDATITDGATVNVTTEAAARSIYLADSALNVTGSGSLTLADPTGSFSADYGATFTIAGADASWNNAGELRLFSTTLTFDQGATVTTGGGFLAEFSSNVATINVRDGATWSGGDFLIGRGGSGTLNIEGGAEATLGYLVVGNFTTGVGTLNVSGADTTLSTGILRLTRGSLNVSDGAVVRSSAAALASWDIPISAQLTATATVTGSGSRWEIDGDLAVLDAVDGAFSNSATLTIADGGGVRVGTTGTGIVTIKPGGTLNIGTGGAAGTLEAGEVRFINQPGTAPILAFNHSDALAFSTLVTGPGVVTKSGSGTLTLTRDNTYTGATAINAGTLIVASSSALGSTASGTTIATDATLSLTNNVTLAEAIDSAGALVNSSGANTLSGPLSGTGSLSVNAGTLTLFGDNTFTGSTTLADGMLILGSANALGSDGSIRFNGGTLQFSEANTTDYSARFSTEADQAYALDTNGQTVTLASALSSIGGSLVKSGDGTLTLSGDNTYTGLTTIQAGTVIVTSSSALGSDAAGTSIAADATLSLTNDVTLAEALENAGALVSSSGENTLSGPLSGAGTIELNAGKLTLAGHNTFTGPTTLAGGILALGSATALGAEGSVRFAGGTLQFSAANTADYSGRFSAEADQTYAIDTNGQDVTFASALSSLGGRVVKSGTGTLILSDTNTYTGPTTIQGGTISISADSGLGAAPSTVSYGHLTLDAGTLASTSTFALDPNRGVLLGTAGGTISPAASTTLTMAGEIAGTGRLTKSGDGTLTLSGANTYTGGTTVSAGTLVGNVASLRGSIVNNGALVFDQGTDATYTGTLSGTGSLNKVGAGKLTMFFNNLSAGSITVTAGELATPGSISDRAALVSGEGSVLSHPSGSRGVGLSGVGSLLVEQGGKVIQPSATTAAFLSLGQNAGSTGTVTVNGVGSALTMASFLRVGFSGSGTMKIEAGATGSFASPSDSLVGVNATGAGGIELTGTGSALTFSAGRLVVGSAGTGTVTIGSGATLTANRLQLAALTGSTGTLNLHSGGTLVVSDASGTALSTGAGNATFNFAGGTLRSNGTSDLTVSSNAVLANATVSTVDTNGRSGTWTGQLSGTGGLAKAGLGTLTLANANTYTGPTQVSAGTLLVNGSLADTAVTVAGSATLGGVGTIGGPATIRSGAALAPGSSPGTLTFTGGLGLEAGANLNFELGATSDLIRVSGGVFSGPSSIGSITVNLQDSGGFAAGVYRLVDFRGATLSSIGATSFALGSTIAGFTYHFSEGDGDFLLTATAIPEPASIAALVGFLALGTAACRRRRHHVSTPEKHT